MSVLSPSLKFCQFWFLVCFAFCILEVHHLVLEKKNLSLQICWFLLLNREVLWCWEDQCSILRALSWAPAYLLDDLGLLDHELVYFVAVSSQWKHLHPSNEKRRLSFHCADVCLLGVECECPCRVTHLSAWSPAGGTVWEGSGKGVSHGEAGCEGSCSFFPLLTIMWPADPCSYPHTLLL